MILKMIDLGWYNETIYLVECFRWIYNKTIYFLFAQAWRGSVPVQTKARYISLCLMMTTVWRRGRKIASVMQMTSAYHLHIVSVTSSKVVVLDHHSQLVVMKLLILPMIPLTLLAHPEVLFCPLALLIQGN